MSKLARIELQSCLEGKTISEIDASTNIIIIKFTDGNSIMLKVELLETMYGISVYWKGDNDVYDN